jgi:cephalosporin hydroxylase
MLVTMQDANGKDYTTDVPNFQIIEKRENLSGTGCGNVTTYNAQETKGSVIEITPVDPIESTKSTKSIDETIPEQTLTLQQVQKAVNDFHNIWYPLQGTVTWMGHHLQKCPLDLFIYQEIIYECKPDLIIECGTWMGGSALYMANLCDIINHGHILTIDINQVPTAPIHPRISYLIGSSVSENVLNVVQGYINSVRKVMVILDSDHTKQHVLDELSIYSRLVSPQQYLIVEDSNIHGHPTRCDLPAGPYEAINEFYKSDPISACYIQDKMCERFLMTFNPNGYLRRIK